MCSIPVLSQLTVDFSLRIPYNGYMKHMFYLLTSGLLASPRLRASLFPWSLAYIPSSPRLRVLRVSLFPWSLAFIPSYPRLRDLRVSLFSLSYPRIPSHSSGQKEKNFINFHFITKSRFKNHYFPFISASDFVIYPKRTKINQARNDYPSQNFHLKCCMRVFFQIYLIT
jgi:hypothetical protein